MSRPAVAVVVPSCARPRLLSRCLAALMRQTLAGSAFEVVVVDDADDDATRSVAAAAAAGSGAGPRVYCLSGQPRRGPAAARNAGWRFARAPVVAFTDDDTIPDSDWLRCGLAAMAGGAAAVRGRIEVPTPGPLTDHALMTKGLERAEFVTANCFVRREALLAVGGFDERFRRAWREDSDLHFELLRRFGEVPAAPQAIVRHPVRPAPWGISVRQQANAMFDALLYRKHPTLYRARCGRVHAPRLYYAIVGSTAVAFAAAAGGSRELAAGGGLAAAGLAGVLAWRRLRPTSRAPAHVLEMVVTSCVIPFLALGWRLAGAVRFRVPFF
jgi:glycosyltransferase involved in cell wall biosynthesis